MNTTNMKKVLQFVNYTNQILGFRQLIQFVNADHKRSVTIKCREYLQEPLQFKRKFSVAKGSALEPHRVFIRGLEKGTKFQR